MSAFCTPPKPPRFWRRTDFLCQTICPSTGRHFQQRSQQRNPDMTKVTKLNLIGQRFSRLLVLDGPLHISNGISQKQVAWKCLCDCGTEKILGSYKITSGKTRSCGCLIVEHMKEMRTGKPPSTARHFHSHSPTYRSWYAMLQRCTNKNNHRYDCYGGRGITVCDRWRLFDNFLADMGERPFEMTIDRINVNGNYEVANCRWATSKEQAANKRKPSKLTISI